MVPIVPIRLYLKAWLESDNRVLYRHYLKDLMAAYIRRQSESAIDRKWTGHS